MKKFCGILLAILLSFHSVSSAADRGLDEVVKDPGGGQAIQPDHTLLRIVAVGGILSLLYSQDQRLNSQAPHYFANAFGELDSKDFGKRHTFFERLGRLPGAAQISGSFYLAGIITRNENARKVGVLALEAKVVNDFVTTGLKHAIGRKRPGSQSDGDEFKPFGETDSFPSGHTSSAFALAAVVADNYDQKWVKITSYSLATAVGIGRINQGAHWASDVAGGALVGYAVGKLISRLERQKGWSRALYFGGDRIGYKKEFGGAKSTAEEE